MLTQEDIEKLKDGETYRAVADKYNVSISCISRWALKLGYINGWKQKINNDKKNQLIVDISKDLCVIPNLTKVCKLRKISYFGFISKTGFRTRAIGCYKSARNKCKICGIDITNRKHYSRLCLIHKISEDSRQYKLRIKRKGIPSKKRIHRYFVESNGLNDEGTT